MYVFSASLCEPNVSINMLSPCIGFALIVKIPNESMNNVDVFGSAANDPRSSSSSN